MERAGAGPAQAYPSDSKAQRVSEQQHKRFEPRVTRSATKAKREASTCQDDRPKVRASLSRHSGLIVSMQIDIMAQTCALSQRTHVQVRMCASTCLCTGVCACMCVCVCVRGGVCECAFMCVYAYVLMWECAGYVLLCSVKCTCAPCTLQRSVMHGFSLCRGMCSLKFVSSVPLSKCPVLCSAEATNTRLRCRRSWEPSS